VYWPGITSPLSRNTPPAQGQNHRKVINMGGVNMLQIIHRFFRIVSGS
jgi:hypothetical protein